MIKIALADSDLDYIGRLETVLNNYKELAISIYSEKKALENALASKKFDVLLFDPSIYEGQIEVGKDTLVIMLYDDELPVPDGCASYKKVKKFQRISTTYQQIMYEYSEYAQRKGIVIGGNKTRTIAVYSPIGGSGKTTVALATALRLSLEGKKTFYMNLEDAASDDCFLQSSSDKGLSEIAANLGTNIDFTMKIQGILQQKNDCMFYLKHFDSPNDVYELSGDERIDLLEKIENTKLFDVIVIDMSSSLKAEELKIFEAVDSILLVERNSSISNNKMKLFLNQMHIINSNKSKMSRVINFNMGMGSRVESDIPVVGTINATQNPESAGFISWLAEQPATNFALDLIG